MLGLPIVCVFNNGRFGILLVFLRHISEFRWMNIDMCAQQTVKFYVIDLDSGRENREIWIQFLRPHGQWNFAPFRFIRNTIVMEFICICDKIRIFLHVACTWIRPSVFDTNHCVRLPGTFENVHIVRNQFQWLASNINLLTFWWCLHAHAYFLRFMHTFIIPNSHIVAKWGFFSSVAH